MKKLFALLLAIMMMATLSVTAFAADYDTAGNKGMNVTYSVNPGYTVTIPETVTIGADGTEKTVSAEGVVVEKGEYVSVTLSENNNFTVKTPEGAELTYTVTKDGQPVAAGDEILAVNPVDSATGTANITFDIDESAIQYAGTYTGSATFTIAVKDVAKITFSLWDDETFNLTAEEGMTWEKWIASEYNELGLTIDGDYITGSSGGHVWDNAIDSNPIITDEIVAGRSYGIFG